MGRVSCPVRQAAERFPNSPALFFEGRSWSWLETDQLVSAWAQWLRTRGVEAGARVATLSWNRPELLWLWFALGRLGASLVPLNARFTSAELSPLVDRSNARFVLASDELRERLSTTEPFPSLEPVAKADAPFHSSRELAALFTSGTTGTPSLIPLTGANFMASAIANATNLGSSSQQTWLGTLPLFHVGGLAMAFRCAVMGARLWLEPSFDAVRVSERLRSNEITHASLVPTSLTRVLDVSNEPFSPSLEAILIGGGPMGSALLTRARARRLPVLQTYGLTEACSQVTTERLADADGTTAGSPLPGLEVSVVTDHGTPAAVGEIGLIRVKGPTVTPVAGEWLETNDLGSLDSRGRLSIAARRVDLIVSGGENVYPAEVEAALLESGLVDDVGIAPVDDATWGQIPVAFVVWKRAADEPALLAFARSRLAAFKIPKRVVTLETLPRNASGKLLRHRLR